METKLTTFKLPSELHKKIKEIAAREGTDMTEILIKQLEEYIKIHGSGNPVYSLDNWKDPNFKAVPAFMTGLETWVSYFYKCDEKELKEIYDKACSIKMGIEKRFPI